MNFEQELLRRETDPAHIAERAQRAEMAKADVIRRQHDTFVASGVPARFVEIVEAGIGQTEATEAAWQVIDGVAVLSGDPGCGKTVAACAWLRDLIVRPGAVVALEGYRGRQPLFVTSARLSRWDRYDNEQMNRLLKADRLVIDDVGSEFADVKGNFNAILDELVSDRHGNRRPLIITTNLDGDAFKARYDERIADRIREVGRFVSIKAPSMRKRLADAKSAP